MFSLPPEPTAYEKETSQTLLHLIRTQIKQHNGFIPFDYYVNLVLYTPSLGYYAREHQQIGRKGDFVTAPELHPIFAQTLTEQLVPLLINGKKIIYEFGAGNGILAADLLTYLPEQLIDDYYIIELSAPLREKQRATIQSKCPQAINKLHHLNTLPNQLSGIVLANEVLDAIPFNLIKKNYRQFWEIGVSLGQENQLIYGEKKLEEKKAAYLAAQTYLSHCPEPYQSELHLQQQAFIRSISERMEKAVMIIFDYGFDAQEYYLPQRSMGTMMAYYHHHSLHDPFFYPGLLDLTTHINFSAIAEAVIQSGADLLGYTTQSHFLFNLGITEYMHRIRSLASEQNYYAATCALQTLVYPHEMGEIFKVMAWGKNNNQIWQAFTHGDLTHKL